MEIALKMSQAGLDKLRKIADQLQEAADLLGSAHGLFLDLRDSEGLTMFGDVTGAETSEPPATTIVS